MRTQADFAEFLAAADVSAEGGTDARELMTTALSGARELGMEGVVVRLESLLRTA